MMTREKKNKKIHLKFKYPVKKKLFEFQIVGKNVNSLRRIYLQLLEYTSKVPVVIANFKINKTRNSSTLPTTIDALLDSFCFR